MPPILGPDGKPVSSSDVNPEDKLGTFLREYINFVQRQSGEARAHFEGMFTRTAWFISVLTIIMTAGGVVLSYLSYQSIHEAVQEVKSSAAASAQLAISGAKADAVQQLVEVRADAAKAIKDAVSEPSVQLAVQKEFSRATDELRPQLKQLMVNEMGPLETRIRDLRLKQSFVELFQRYEFSNLGHVTEENFGVRLKEAEAFSRTHVSEELFQKTIEGLRERSSTFEDEGVERRVATFWAVLYAGSGQPAALKELLPYVDRMSELPAFTKSLALFPRADLDQIFVALEKLALGPRPGRAYGAQALAGRFAEEIRSVAPALFLFYARGSPGCEGRRQGGYKDSYFLDFRRANAFHNIQLSLFELLSDGAKKPVLIAFKSRDLLNRIPDEVPRKVVSPREISQDDRLRPPDPGEMGPFALFDTKEYASNWYQRNSGLIKKLGCMPFTEAKDLPLTIIRKIASNEWIVPGEI